MTRQRKRRSDAHLFVCSECPAVFSCSPAMHGTNTSGRRGTWTCSAQCSAKRRARKRAEARGATCAKCGVFFLAHSGRAGIQQFCSQACDRAARVEARRGYTPPSNQPVGTVWIELGEGAFTLIDADDASVVGNRVWWKNARGYAATKVAGNRSVLLHRLLLPDAKEVDHRNGDRLDNRRANLRSVTRQQNAVNRRPNAGQRFKGVHESHGRWVARASSHGKRIYLGLFDTPEEAARAYDARMRAEHGEYAALNFPAEPAVAIAQGFGKRAGRR